VNTIKSADSVPPILPRSQETLGEPPVVESAEPVAPVDRVHLTIVPGSSELQTLTLTVPQANLPLEVSALPLSAGEGKLVAVTSISIAQQDDPANSTKGRYAASNPRPVSHTLAGAYPGKTYNISVAWADDSDWSGTHTNDHGRNSVLVAQP
jgi:hypothetical protein